MSILRYPARSIRAHRRGIARGNARRNAKHRSGRLLAAGFPRVVLLVVAGAVGLVVCPLPAHDEPAFTLRSAAFRDGAEIPFKYTCEGSDVAPPLAWTGIPQHTRSFALIVVDPDAPDPRAPSMTWVHWVLYNIPARTTNLAGGRAGRDLPAGTRAGLNDWNKAAYGGPCPPVGRHRYFFRLYALDTVLSDQGHPTRAALKAALEGHVIGRATLMGTYRKIR